MPITQLLTKSIVVSAALVSAIICLASCGVTGSSGAGRRSGNAAHSSNVSHRAIGSVNIKGFPFALYSESSDRTLILVASLTATNNTANDRWSDFWGRASVPGSPENDIAVFHMLDHVLAAAESISTDGRSLAPHVATNEGSSADVVHRWWIRASTNVLSYCETCLCVRRPAVSFAWWLSEADAVVSTTNTMEFMFVGRHVHKWHSMNRETFDLWWPAFKKQASLEAVLGSAKVRTEPGRQEASGKD